MAHTYWITDGFEGEGSLCEMHGETPRRISEPEPARAALCGNLSTPVSGKLRGAHHAAASVLSRITDYRLQDCVHTIHAWGWLAGRSLWSS